MHWKKKERLAQALMKERASCRSVLVEIAAQHPLTSGRTPGAEFEARLNLGKKLCDVKTAEGYYVELYVPGSRHRHGNAVDEISLSEAGCAYLAEQGIPRELLRGEELSLRYKRESGVFGSADECFVSASYYKDEGFGLLLAVVSPAQLMRKALHYIEFGVHPLLYSAPVEDMFHSYVEEAAVAIPRVLHLDHSLQHPDSDWARELRAERRP
jgi:hypothetical protein